MNTLKRLTAIASLTLGLCLSAYGDQCTQPEGGEVHAPPCAAQVASSDSTESQIVTNQTSNSVDIYPIVDTAIDSLRSVLSVY